MENALQTVVTGQHISIASRFIERVKAHLTPEDGVGLQVQNYGVADHAYASHETLKIRIADSTVLEITITRNK